MITKNNQIKKEIMDLIDVGMTDKQKIYSKVVDNLSTQRPTVRRACGELLKELEYKISILKQNGHADKKNNN